jgi:hypothetical protein
VGPGPLTRHRERKSDRMRVLAIALTIVVSVTAEAAVWLRGAAAEEAERGFADLYAGVVHLFESDVPGWKLEDTVGSIGARMGFWIGKNWGLTFRTWYFQTDANLQKLHLAQ